MRTFTSRCLLNAALVYVVNGELEPQHTHCFVLYTPAVRLSESCRDIVLYVHVYSIILYYGAVIVFELVTNYVF